MCANVRKSGSKTTRASQNSRWNISNLITLEPINFGTESMVFRKELETPPSPSFYFSDEQEITFPTVHLLMSEWQPWSSTYSGLSPVISHTIRAQIDSSQDGMKWPLKRRTLDHVKAPMRQTEREREGERGAWLSCQ